MMSDYMSRQLANAVFPLIKTEWALSDTQLGSLASVVALIVGVMIIPVSLVVDRVGRVKAITAMAVTWGLATIACGLAGSFASLFAARAFVGLGEAGYGSAGGAIQLQVFPKRFHSSVLGVFLSGSVFGSILGLVTGGSLAQRYGWQMAFILVGAAGTLLALCYPLAIKEPPRPAEADAATLPLGQLARLLLTTRTAICAYLGLAANMFVQGTMIVWAPSYANRYLGMEPAAAARAAGLLALGSGLGMIAGGFVVERLSRQDQRNRLRMPAAFAFFAAIILLAAFRLAPGIAQLTLVGIGLLVGNLVIGSPGAVVTDVIPAANHATALATMSLFMNVLGSAPGPVVAGWIADTSDLHTALEWVPIVLFVSTAAFALGAASYAADRQRLNALDIKNLVTG